MSFHFLSEGIVGKELLAGIIDSSPKVEIDCINDTPAGSLRALSWVHGGFLQSESRGSWDSFA